MEKNPPLCPHCGRIDNGAPKCRDHPAPQRGQRVLAQLGGKVKPDA